MSIIHKDIQRDLSDIALKTQNLMVVNDVLNKIEVIDPDIYVTYSVDSYYITSTNKLPTVRVRNVSLDTLKRIKQLLQIKTKATKQSDEWTVDEIYTTDKYILKAQWDTDKLGCELEYEEKEVGVENAYIADDGTIVKKVTHLKGIKCGTITKKIKEVFSGNSQ